MAENVQLSPEELAAFAQAEKEETQFQQAEVAHQTVRGDRRLDEQAAWELYEQQQQ